MGASANKYTGIPDPYSGHVLAPLSLKGIVVDGAGGVLLGRKPDGRWELLGGRPHPDEPFERCVEREVAEESGLRVRTEAIITAWPSERILDETANIIAYGCSLADPDAQPVASAEHTVVAFVPGDALPEALSPATRRAIGLWRERAST